MISLLVTCSVPHNNFITIELDTHNGEASLRLLLA